MTETPIWAPPTFGPIPQPVTTATGIARYDVQYRIQAGFRPLELELYLPESKQAAPLVIWIHGGGYAGGSRVAEAPWIESSDYIQKTLERGFAIARIDYRLGFEASFPAAVNDAHSAIAWLTIFSQQLNLDCSRIFLWGSSAGGHLAALVANTLSDSFFNDGKGAETSEAVRIAGLVDWYGASNLNSIVRPMDGTDLSIPEAFRFPPEYFNLGSERWKDRDWLAKASPVKYVDEDFPPTLLVHGDADTMVPLQQSGEFAAALSAAGVTHELVVIPGGNHAWLGLEQAAVDEIVKQSLDFMEKCP